jgi:hypothetical protein
MAYDSLTLAAVSSFIVILLVFILFLVFSKRTTAGDRERLIRAYKAVPRKAAHAPVLVHGPAGSALPILSPCGGQVAFYAAFIMSKDSILVREPGDMPLHSASSFRIFSTSGDFFITEAGVPYTISIVSALEREYGTASPFTRDQKLNAVLSGIPESVFGDMENFEAAVRALVPVFTIAATWTSVTSAIDSRVRTFTHGRDVPPAVADLLRGKIIRLQPGDEIRVVEFYIPVKKTVWVFGYFDGTDTVLSGDPPAALSVSFEDPEQAGGT